MNHFDISEWTDFVRGVLLGERRSVLEGHLATGCEKCSATCALLGRVVSVSAADTKWSVPDELAAAAEAVFVQQNRPSTLERIVARLVYDSRTELQTVGARAGRSSTRQVAFEAGDYYLDLSLERDATQICLLGQLASRKSPSAALEGQTVFLMAGDQVAGRAITNEFGEFSIDFRPRKKLRLCFPVATEGAQIEVPLEEYP